MATNVSLISPYSSLTSIDSTGVKTYGLNNAATPNTAFVGNVTGYVYNANGASAQTIYVNTDHAWVINGTANDDTIYGGAGNDTINTKGNDVVYGGAGSDVFNVATGSGNITLSDYTFGADKLHAALTTNGAANFAAAATNFNKAGAVEILGANVILTAQNNFYEVTVADEYNVSRNVWFGGTTAALMDGSAQTAALVMHGDNNNAAGDAASAIVADTLLGGSGKDTIYAGLGDYADGGAGNDNINVTANSVTVGFTSAGGKDTVSGFGAGFKTDAGAANTVLYLSGNALTDATIATDGANATVTLGTSSIELDAISATPAGTQMLVKDNTGTTSKVTVAHTTAAADTITPATVNDVADVFVGSSRYNTTVDFSTSTIGLYDPLTVDLGNTGSYGSTSKYYNIKAVKGSTAVDTKLIGAANVAETLIAGGTVATSLWGGGAAADTLVGAANGKDTFFFGNGDGKDVVTTFTAGTANDTISLLSGGVSSVTHSTAGNLTLTLGSASDVLTVQQTGTASADDEFNISVGGTTVVAKVGINGQVNTLAYDSAVTYYYGGNKADTISYAGTDNQEIWLNNSTATKYYGVENIDASTSIADVKLMGDSNANVITGGKGTSTLWGGAGNDTLVGGTGTNIFGFGKGEGNDVVTTTNATDKVVLYNVATANLDMTKTGLSNGSMTVALTDGSSLTLKNYGATSVNTFVLTDATYTYDYTKKSWTKQ